MKVVITGGCGFIGLRLARALEAKGALTCAGGEERPISRIVAFDQAPPPPDARIGPLVEVRTGDILRDAGGLVDAETGVVFHLASVVSAGAEADFDLGYRVNLDGSRALFEACRAQTTTPRLVFASSIAVYGGVAAIDDSTRPTPLTSYGAQKAICELLINDYTRKGFLDGRSARLPTVVVRPGKPNKAASGFASSIIREPLMGREAICPVSPETPMVVTSPRRVVDSLIALAEIEGAALGHDRAVLLPGIAPTMAEMLAALERVAGAAATACVRFAPDALIAGIVAGWPQAAEARRGPALGLKADPSVDAIIEAFIADELGGRIA